jgi:hypothetical protein
MPLALNGTRRVLRGGTWLPRPGPIRLWLGAPVATAGTVAFHDLLALRDRVAAIIAAHCDEPRLDISTAGTPHVALR